MHAVNCNLIVNLLRLHIIRGDSEDSEKLTRQRAVHKLYKLKSLHAPKGERIKIDN